MCAGAGGGRVGGVMERLRGESKPEEPGGGEWGRVSSMAPHPPPLLHLASIPASPLHAHCWAIGVWHTGTENAASRDCWGV